MNPHHLRQSCKIICVGRPVWSTYLFYIRWDHIEEFNAEAASQFIGFKTDPELGVGNRREGYHCSSYSEVSQ